MAITKQAAVVFPHQLLASHPALDSKTEVFVCEEKRYFTDFRFHKKKLVFHKASILAYIDYLRDRGNQVHFVPLSDRTTYDLLGALEAEGIEIALVADISDHLLNSKLYNLSDKHGILIKELETPSFLTSRRWIEEKMGGKDSYRFTEFYIERRKELGILIEGEQPAGGKWTFDTQNRKSLPRDNSVPQLPSVTRAPQVSTAIDWVEDKFPENPGTVNPFNFPVTHEDSRAWFESFLNERLALFGDYQDSISGEGPLLFHSLISPLLNIGLLTPGMVISRTLEFAEGHDIPIKSLEGFIRQIIGWREYVRAIYMLRGEEQRNSNFWNHSRPLPDSFYEANTGIDPVDLVLKRVLDSGYAHHIERLMVLGNFLLLCEIRPEDSYRWFMEMFIDAYDWVMVPNLFGMSQYADGGMMTTKPYICSSNYILKMSDLPSGDWCKYLDALFWRFVDKHREFLRKNPRTALIVSNLQRMDQDRRRELVKMADEFLEKLDQDI